MQQRVDFRVEYEARAAAAEITRARCRQYLWQPGVTIESSFFLPTMGRAAALVVLAWLRCAGAQIPEGIGFDDDDFFRPTQKPVQVNTYQQGAEHEWDDPHDDDYSDDGATIRTQCYTGSDLYQTEKTFCDLECLDSYKGKRRVSRASGRDGAIDDVDCSGPWYCSKMEICQMYHQKNTNDQEQGFQRGCMTVRSCANHSQCFPTAQDQRNMNIQWYDGWDGTMADLGSRIRDHGFKMFYGGMTFETTCCVNRHNYRPGIDTPCNAASATTVRGALAFAALVGVGALLRGT